MVMTTTSGYLLAPKTKIAFRNSIKLSQRWKGKNMAAKNRWKAAAAALRRGPSRWRYKLKNGHIENLGLWPPWIKRPCGQPGGQQRWAKLELTVVNRNWLTKLHFPVENTVEKHASSKVQRFLWNDCSLTANQQPKRSKFSRRRANLSSAAVFLLLLLLLQQFLLTHSLKHQLRNTVPAQLLFVGKHTLLYSALCSSMHRSIPLIANDVIEVCRQWGCHWISFFSLSIGCTRLVLKEIQEEEEREEQHPSFL